MLVGIHNNSPKFVLASTTFSLSLALSPLPQSLFFSVGSQNMRRVARELGESLGEEELQAMIDEFDRDQDGEINEEEFFYIMKQTSIY